MHTPRTIVVGLGNPILGDDGVGWRVAQALQALDCQELDRAPLSADVECLALGGLSLMESLIGYERAIIIDALHTTEAAPGRISILALEELPDLSCGHTTAAHDTSLQTALRVGRAMGAALPEDIIIVAVTAERVYDFCEDLSPPLAAAVPEALGTVLSLLDKDPVN